MPYRVYLDHPHANVGRNENGSNRKSNDDIGIQSSDQFLSGMTIPKKKTPMMQLSNGNQHSSKEEDNRVRNESKIVHEGNESECSIKGAAIESNGVSEVVKKRKRKLSEKAKVQDKKPISKRRNNQISVSNEPNRSIKNGTNKGNRQPDTIESETNQSLPKFPTNPNVYEKHRRELEKSLERLEKFDKFAFFLDLPDRENSETNDCNPVELEGFSRTSSRAMATLLVKDTSGTTELEPTQSCLDVSTEHNKDQAHTRSFDYTAAGPPLNFSDIRQRLDDNYYIINRQDYINAQALILATKLGISFQELSGIDAPIVAPNKYAINWDLVRDDVFEMCNEAIAKETKESNKSVEGDCFKSGTITHSALKIKEMMESIHDRLSKKHQTEIELIEMQERYQDLFQTNTEAAVQGEWRRQPFPERQYQRLQETYALCSGLSSLDRKTAEHDLNTNLPEGFYGMPYNYDQSGSVSEGWMNDVAKQLNDKRKRRKDYDPANHQDELQKIIQTQVTHAVEQLIVNVQDRVLTSSNTLDQKELCPAGWNSSNITSIDNGPPAVVEQFVWGIDRYTAKNVTLALGMEYSDVAKEFIDAWLLPAINACDPNSAHDISNATQFLQGLPPKDGSMLTEFGKILLQKVQSMGPIWLADAARKLNTANAIYDGAFCIHPKGQGVVVIKEGGLKSGTLVTHYLGELYPSWRWSEKMDAIEATQTILGMRPALADFYNMCMERPMHDKRGYGLLFVDASRKAGWASALSHSCNPTCQVQVVSRAGKLSLSMTTVRDVPQGHELTFDYNAVTESLNEYRQAVCLCGHDNCRGSFLHFAMADCYQEVMRNRCPMSVRFTLLIRASKFGKLTDQHKVLLKKHRFGMAAFGAASFNEVDESEEHVPVWLRIFVAEVLQYIQVERKTLPIQLISNEVTSKRRASGVKVGEQDISYLGADLEGRMHMEQRIQSLTQTLSLVGRVLSIHRLATKCHDVQPPLSLMSDQDIIDQIWRNSNSAVEELFYQLQNDSAVNKSFVSRMELIRTRFSFLKHPFENKNDARIGRRYLTKALLDCRKIILSSLSGGKKSRGKLEAVSDLLLLYAHTKNFFTINQYQAFQSTPIEVYARELGNDVPRAAVELVRRQKTGKSSVKIFKQKTNEGLSEYYKPEEAVASVQRNYSGDYVMTQLLYWFNGGIGTRPGLPGMMGAVLLPSIASWWNVNSKDEVSEYSTKIRPLLEAWIKDPKLRRESWPDKLEKFFTRRNIMVGSPALDSTITGKDEGVESIQLALEKLREDEKQKLSSKRNNDCRNGDTNTSDQNMHSRNIDESKEGCDEDLEWFGCICGIPHPYPIKVFWLQCDECECWFNVSCNCVGFDEENAKTMDKWSCWACNLPCNQTNEMASQ